MEFGFRIRQRSANRTAEVNLVGLYIATTAFCLVLRIAFIDCPGRGPSGLASLSFQTLLLTCWSRVVDSRHSTVTLSFDLFLLLSLSHVLYSY